MDAEMRSKTAEYSSLEQKLNQVNQSNQGNLLTRDITKDIAPKKDKIIESKYLTTVFVVVARYVMTVFHAFWFFSVDVKEWMSSYETVNEFVVPASCTYVEFSLYFSSIKGNFFACTNRPSLVKQENDFSLFMVVVMKHAADDFKTKCRAKR